MRRGTIHRICTALAVVSSMLALSQPAAAADAPPATDEPTTAEAGLFPDVPSDHWAVGAIRFVTDSGWMPAGTEGFRPDDPFTRRDLARAMFLAFPPPSRWSSDRTFGDVAADDPLLDAFRWAAHRRFLPVKNDAIRPDGNVSLRLLDPAIVRGLRFARYATPVSKLHTETGQRVVFSWATGFMFVAERLGLHHNYRNESVELRPGQPRSRAHAAGALRRLANVMSKDRGALTARLSGYQEITLPELSPMRLEAARFAFRGAGFPYVWAGEYHRPSVGGYPYGSQAQGGFDCTGFAWWVLHRSHHEGYAKVERMRGYEGWNLPWRTATQIAANTDRKRAWSDLLPMDLGFFDFDGDPSRIDHAGLMIGNGWVLHSSGSKGGVTLERADIGYMRNAFLYARRVIRVDQ